MELVTRKQLSRELGISERSLKRHLPQLELLDKWKDEKDRIVSEQRGGRLGPTLYNSENVRAAIQQLPDKLVNAPQWKARHRAPLAPPDELP